MILDLCLYLLQSSPLPSGSFSDLAKTPQEYIEYSERGFYMVDLASRSPMHQHV
ncbi:MAG: hypothetical protein QXQ57_03980 [Sulfolobales archaeon]